MPIRPEVALALDAPTVPARAQYPSAARAQAAKNVLMETGVIAIATPAN
jgi:hypothetical protein